MMGRRARSSLIKYLSNPSSGSSSEDRGCASQGKCEVVKCNSYDRNSVYIKYTCVVYSNVCMCYCLKKHIHFLCIIHNIFMCIYIYIHYVLYVYKHTYLCMCIHTVTPGKKKRLCSHISVWDFDMIFHDFLRLYLWDEDESISTGPLRDFWLTGDGDLYLQATCFLVWAKT